MLFLLTLVNAATSPLESGARTCVDLIVDDKYEGLVMNWDERMLCYRNLDAIVFCCL